MKPIRILYINGGIMDRGGISNYMMNYYRNIDRDKVQIDFVVHGFEKGTFDDEIYSLGGKIYNIPIKSKNYLGNIRALKQIFKSGDYKIVHSHMDAMGYIPLKIAKKCGIPIRISHSHSISHLTTNKIKYIMNEYARNNIVKYITHFCACSKQAGIWLYGEKYKEKIQIINNAIDLSKFNCKNDEYLKLPIKKELKGNLVIGHVGHFNYIKNHDFLINVFKEIQDKVKDSKLLLIGEGQEKNRIEQKVTELGIREKVHFIGAKSNVYDYMGIMDCFILPSLFEGLPVSVIEAQAKSLRCFVSDRVTREVAITKNIDFISLDLSEKEWSKIILEKLNLFTKIDTTEDIREKGFDIKVEAKKLQRFYIELYNKEV